MRISLNLSLNNPRTKAAVITIVASVLLLAGIVTVVAPRIVLAADDKRTCHVTGTFTTALVSDLASTSVGSLQTRTRVTVTNYTGDFVGQGITLRQNTIDTTAKKEYDSGLVTMIGSLCGSPSGKLTGVFTFTADLSTPGIRITDGKLIVQEGSGQGGFEGICGGGTLMGSGPPAGPFTTTYNYTFRFGDACNSNP